MDETPGGSPLCNTYTPYTETVMFGFMLAVCIAGAWLGVHYGIELPSRLRHTVVTKIKAPARLASVWEHWHEHHCSVPGAACVAMDVTPLLPGPIKSRLDGPLGMKAKQFASDKVSRMPDFTLRDDFAVVSFKCCYNDPLYEYGYRLAESETHIITMEVGPHDDILRIALSNKRHCLTPPNKPLGVRNKMWSRASCFWPDHFHTWLTDSDMADAWLEPNEIGIWDESQIPYQPDVTYTIVTAVKQMIQTLPVYYFA